MRLRGGAGSTSRWVVAGGIWLSATVAPFAREALAQEAGRDEPSDVSSAIEEIVVTARKRAELIEDTPLAVTALGVEQLRAADVTRLTEIRQFAPNLQIQSISAAVDTASNFRIRGIGTTRSGTSFDPGVGIYLDDVFIPGGVSSLMNLVDIQQVAVLRGPQGTLFGKNTVGGAISITTAKPSDEIEGSLLVRPGNFDLVDTRAMLNLPIHEDLAARFALTTTNASGYHQNTLRGAELGEMATIGFLGSFRWRATEAITVDLSGQWNRNRVAGGADRCVVAEDSSAPLAPPGFLDACRNSRPFRGRHDVHELSDQQGWGTWAVVNWDLGAHGPFEELFLKSISSWRGGAIRLRADVDGTEQDVVRLAAIGPAPEDGGESSGDTFMEELQLGGVAFDGRLKFIVGAFGFWEKNELPQTTIVNIAGVRRQGGVSVATTDNWDWALFTQATGDVTDWLSITAGVRYTQEKKGIELGGQVLFPEPGPPIPAVSGRRVFDSWTPMASVALTAPDEWTDDTPLEHLMTYFTYSRGFRGGGFNSAPNNQTDGNILDPFEPESLDAFEIGVKSIAFEERFRMSLALFHYEYEDVQVLTTELSDDGNNLTQPIRNAADATGRGVEFEFQAMPIPGLSLSGSIGFIDTEFNAFESVSDVDGAPLDRAGESMNNTPELQTNLAVQFSLPVEVTSWPSLSGFLTPRLQWYYQSAEHYGGPELREARQSGYNLLNARLTYTFMDGRAQVALWGKNLTDRAYFSNAQPLASSFGFVARTYNLPRTYGAELSYRFGEGA